MKFCLLIEAGLKKVLKKIKILNKIENKIFEGIVKKITKPNPFKPENNIKK